MFSAPSPFLHTIQVFHLEMALSDVTGSIDALSTKVSCANCGAEETNMKVCSGCRVAHYCSRECQSDHWTRHKSICGTAKKMRQTSRTRNGALKDRMCVVCKDKVILLPPLSHEFACGHSAHFSCHEKRGETSCASCGAFGAAVTGDVREPYLDLPRNPDGTPADRGAIMAALMSLRTPWYDREDTMGIISDMLGYIFQAEKTKRTGTDGTVEEEREFIRTHIEAIRDPDDLKNVLIKYQQMARELLPKVKRLVADNVRVVSTKKMPEDLAHDIQKLRRGLAVAFAVPLLSVPNDGQFLALIPTYLHTMGF